jgi:hypothetical protein
MISIISIIIYKQDRKIVKIKFLIFSNNDLIYIVLLRSPSLLLKFIMISNKNLLIMLTL